MYASVAITGAASGLGRVIATALLARGQPVVLIDRDAEQAQAVAEVLGSRHEIPVPVVVADLATIAGVHLAADLLSEGSSLGGLVNNAGGWLPGDQYPDVRPDTWLSAITLNLLAPMLLTQRLWPALSAASGAVVNIGSSGGIGDAPYGSPEYGAAKAGVQRFTACLGSRTDVRVTSVVPGWIRLDRARHEWATLTHEAQREVGPLIPPEHIANVVVTLLDRGRPGEVVTMLRNGEQSSSAAQ
jgi:NAD(P)-dependent dehydrogenase (short-subunit alcohol dehydrogenase family)